MKQCVLILSLLLSFSLVSAQTPTPLPGTPQALTCVDFDPGAGALTGVEVISNWNYLDRACIVLHNTTGGAIEISGCQAYFGLTSNFMFVDIRIWEIQRLSDLPDLSSAGSVVSNETYAFSLEPVAGEPETVLATFDLENYNSGSVPMAVINPDKYYALEFMYSMEDPSFMKITADAGVCPPTTFDFQRNLFFDWNEASPGDSSWNFKEDIGNQTDFLMGVTYYDGADPKTPSMGIWGLFGLLGVLSILLKRRINS